MNEKRVYDYPTRVFHWLFATLFVVAFVIGNTVDDDSTVFSYHMLAGILLCFVVGFRVLWGILGSKHARFADFALNPRELIVYLNGVLTKSSRKWEGHNPASSWAAIIMLVFALSLGITGYLMSSGQAGEELKEVHELLANGFLVIVLLHIAGIILHSLRHRDSIWKSMFTGRKSNLPSESTQVPSYAAVGVLLLLATFGVSTYLAQNFDKKTRNLTLFGTKLHLAEADDGEREHSEHNSRNKHHKQQREH